MIPPRTLMRLGGVDPAGEEAILRGLAAGKPDAVGPLAAIAEQFYEAGGRWTSHEWAALTPVERQACVIGAREVRGRDARRQAVLTALATRPGAAEEMAVEFDGGALLEDAANEAMLDRVEDAAERVRRGSS